MCVPGYIYSQVECFICIVCACVCVVSQVQDTKAELNSLGDGIEEIRSICRQLHTHLRKIPECTIIPFEDEADALMDRWLDVSKILTRLLKIFSYWASFTI